MENVKELLEVLMKLVVIPAIPVLVKYAVDALMTWSNSKAHELENEMVAEYLADANEVIFQAVICTTQTFVDSLKAQGKFDAEAQKIAFEKTKDTVMRLLSEEALDFIKNMYGDVDLWLKTKIEQTVNETKCSQPILIAEA